MGDLTASFSRAELECSHCGEFAWGEHELDELQKLRTKYGYPMHLSSAYRCELHPEEAKKAEPGAHAHGAVDVSIYGDKALRLLLAALDLGWTGFGIAQKGDLQGRFIHLDRMWGRPNASRPGIWSY